MRQFITSMSKEGFELYGKTFLERAAECLPGEVVVYTEEEQPLGDFGVQWRVLNEVPGFGWFLDGVQRFPMMHGHVGGLNSRNYRYDIARFCRKSFAQIDAASLNQEEMWWIDADVEFDQPIPEEFFEKQLKGVCLAYLGRPEWHSCASLLGFNNQHRQAADFWASYMRLYMTGTVFALTEWHDSYLIDVLRKELKLVSRNMAASHPEQPGPYNVFDTVMGEYAHHKKGNIKKNKPSRYQQLIDLVKERQPKRILEIGTWNGDRAIEMISVSPTSEYVGFDLFEQATEQTDSDEKNVKPHFRAEDVAQRLQGAGIKYALVGGDTNASLPMYIEKYGEKSADFIFVDGGHSYDTIKSDLENSLKIISEGGIIVMDDFYTGMPEDELKKFGCQSVLADLDIQHEVLPKADPVKDGGFTQMAVVQC